MTYLYHDAPRRKPAARLLPLLAAAVLLAALLAGGLALNRRVVRDMAGQAAAALRETVLSLAVQCYAVEGVYPPSVAYLKAHYGLQVNEERFIVSYDAFAANQLPDVMVLEREGDAA